DRYRPRHEGARAAVSCEPLPPGAQPQISTAARGESALPQALSPLLLGIAPIARSVPCDAGNRMLRSTRLLRRYLLPPPGPHRAFGGGDGAQPRTSDSSGAMSEAGWPCQVHSPVSRSGALRAPRRRRAMCARPRQKDLSMSNILVINASGQETRVALIEQGTISEYYLERKNEKGIVGNIYKGKVVRVLPGQRKAARRPRPAWSPRRSTAWQRKWAPPPRPSRSRPCRPRLRRASRPPNRPRSSTSTRTRPSRTRRMAKTTTRKSSTKPM